MELVRRDEDDLISADQAWFSIRQECSRLAVDSPELAPDRSPAREQLIEERIVPIDRWTGGRRNGRLGRCCWRGSRAWSRWDNARRCCGHRRYRRGTGRCRSALALRSLEQQDRLHEAEFQEELRIDAGSREGRVETGQPTDNERDFLERKALSQR
jgi:hypothetical protein